jgi:hypothetical protein
MRDHEHRRDAPSPRAPATRHSPGVASAGNRAMSELLGPRAVQRWPDLELPDMPSLPDLPSLPSLPDLPSMPSLPDMPSMPSMPTLPSFSLPSLPDVNLNVDTRAGTASGGIDFGGGTRVGGDYNSATGLDFSGQMGRGNASGHVGGPGPWSLGGSTTTRDGTAISGGVSGVPGQNGSGSVTVTGPGGDTGTLGGGLGPGGPSGFGDYHGQYGDIDLHGGNAPAPAAMQIPPELDYGQ